ncbi:MAG: sensor histidine kinase [Desulfobaccales bacterium]
MSKSNLIDSESNLVLPAAASERPDTETGALGRALAELVRYYRHSTVGRRCAGIIHNMNTPLQVIAFQLELLEQKTRKEALLLGELTGPHAPQFQALFDYRRQKLKQLEQEVDRLRDMIHRLVVQSVHEGQEEYCYLDLNQVYQEELNLYVSDPFFKHRVEKEFHFAPGLPPIYGHYVDFSQSLRNFVDNALEAMFDSPRRLLTVVTQLGGNCRLLRIGDTGCGIPATIQPHLFEPFFTTKGTPQTPRAGLGLFMAKRLLRPYRAEIHIDSHPGETWVTVCLPIFGQP